MRPFRNRSLPVVYGLALLGALSSGCGNEKSDASDVDESRVALMTVPTGVLCLRVIATVAGQVVNVPLITVAAGASSTNFSLGRLPAGAASFAATAFDAACSTVTATSVPSWVADPATANLRPGVLTALAMTFRRNNTVSISPNFLENVAEISASEVATYARMTDGTVKQWGNATGAPISSPQPVPTLANVAKVAPGDIFACALRRDGSVACWGSLALVVFGTNPVNITLPGPATDVSAGFDHACVIVATNMYCFGSNVNGQLGNGTTGGSGTPVLVPGNYVRTFAGGNTTCGIQPTGALACWGANSFGQAGTGGTSVSVMFPTVVQSISAIPLRGVVDVAMSTTHACSMRADGLVFCWGDNSFGQLGLNNISMSSPPFSVSGLSDATQLAAGAGFTCARRITSQVTCWGNNVTGQLGDGTATDRKAVGSPIGLTGVLAVRAHSGNHACAELSDLTVACWGGNDAFQLGDGTQVLRFAPVPVLLQ